MIDGWLIFLHLVEWGGSDNWESGAEVLNIMPQLSLACNAA